MFVRRPLTAAARRTASSRPLRTLGPAALGAVTGGATSAPKQEYLVVTLKDCFVTSY